MIGHVRCKKEYAKNYGQNQRTFDNINNMNLLLETFLLLK